jgi:hypothetical protein
MIPTRDLPYKDAPSPHVKERWFCVFLLKWDGVHVYYGVHVFCNVQQTANTFVDFRLARKCRKSNQKLVNG